MSLSPPAQITVPFATGGLKNTIPANANPTDGHAGYDVGFPAINMTPKTAGGIPPFGQDFNGILFDVTTAIRFLEAGGNFPYSSAFATAVGGYPVGSIVSTLARDGLWVNMTANNSTNPDTGGAGWARIGANGTVGSARNVAMNISAASASGALTATEVTVKTALGGTSYCLPSFSATINLGTTGVGGMDTGTAPVSGWVAVYAIYNPITGLSGLLAKNATSGIQTEIYSGANLPAGYAASALLAVLRTTAASIFDRAIVIDRFVHYYSVIFTGTNGTLIATSTSAATPPNAKTIRVLCAITSSAAGQQTAAICTTSGGLGFPGFSQITGVSTAGGQNVTGVFHEIPVIAQQVFIATSTTGTSSAGFNSYGYTF